MDDLSNCTEAEKRRLSELLAALRTPCVSTLSPESDLFTDDFFQEFSSRLLSQHVFLGNPMVQDSFDTAFIAAAQVANYDVQIAPSGQRFWDVAINGRAFSLKTTKAKGLRKDILHISKLTEAAWIQDCRTSAARQEKTLDLFKLYTSEVDSIFQFRFFSGRNFYELVEIPVRLMEGIQKVPRKYFSTDGPSIQIPIGQDPPDFTLKLDRSDSKITLANIVKKNCVVHASWDFTDGECEIGIRACRTGTPFGLK